MNVRRLVKEVTSLVMRIWESTHAKRLIPLTAWGKWMRKSSHQLIEVWNEYNKFWKVCKSQACMGKRVRNSSRGKNRVMGTTIERRK
jgi:hypothetical protein